MRRLRLLLPALIVLATLLRGEEAPNRFEDAIRKFEAADAESAPAEGGVLFLGSSSIRLWKLEKSFPGLDALNRGFGGSHISDSIHFYERIVLRYKPRAIVFYAGDNDIAAGKSPSRVAEDFRAFARRVHADLPRTRVIFVAIKPSIARWKLVDKVRDANRRIEEITRRDVRMRFVDIDAPMLGEDGTPRPELFVDDGLHLSEKGYELWSRLVRAHLSDD